MSDLPPQPAVADDTLEMWGRTQAANEATGVTDQENGWQWLRFLDGIGQILQRVDDLARDDQTTGDPGWSIILDPTRCPTYALPWLAQMVGVRFAAADNTDAAQRAAIRSERGFGRGTVAAIQAAAQQYLGPGQMALIYERTPDPYSFTVVLQLGALAPATFADTQAQYPTFAARTAARSTFSTPAYPQAQVTAALEAAKPAGLVMTVQITAGPTFAQTAAAYPTFAARQAALPTFADVAGWNA